MKKVVFCLMIFIILLLSVSCTAETVTIEGANLPSIDFMQPWAFCEMDREQLSKHFSELKSYGITTVIIQNTVEYEKGKPKVCYYDSNVSFENSYPHFLSDAIETAKQNGLKVIVGTASDSYWWEYGTHGYSEDAMSIFFSEDEKTIDEILSKYEPDGIYYSNEMFSNTKGFEKKWAHNLNKIIDLISGFSAYMPLYLSPFNSSSFSKNTITVSNMWERFFKAVRFRKTDYFLLQDGFGGTSKAFEKETYQSTVRLNSKIRNACTNNCDCNFAINVELFASDGFASTERIKMQIGSANQLGDVIACFSMSHYFKEDESLKQGYIKEILAKNNNH